MEVVTIIFVETVRKVQALRYPFDVVAGLDMYIEVMKSTVFKPNDYF